MKIRFFVYVLIFSFSNAFASNEVANFEWLDDDKEIYVLQNRKYRKSKKFMISGFGTMNFSDKFVSTLGGGLKAGYFFHENWGIEFALGMGSSSENDTSKAIKTQNAIPFYRSITSYTSASIVWVPFYGKFNTFNLVYYLDWFVSAGLASIQTEDNSAAFDLDNSAEIRNNAFALREESATGLTWSTGLYWHLTKLLSVRFEFTGFHYQASSSQKDSSINNVSKDDKWFHNYNLSAGINLMF